ncbi:MAG: FAD-dependent oxidoreductase [Simkaniaceae bacterium]|nr:FAD-dependent oxidoreductase [Simkaniaceae bacterium]
MSKNLVIGSGISGLSLARRLENVTIFDPTDTPGGVIGSRTGRFFFEKGPRSFRVDRCQKLLKIIHELGLEDEIIYASKNSKRRFILHNGRLRSPLSFPAVWWAIANEWRRPLGPTTDESVHDFFCRRLGKRVTDLLIDPVITGIKAADYREVSMQWTFPNITSLTSSFLKKKKGDPRLFTLKSGLQTLIDRLADGLNFTTTQPDFSHYDTIYSTIPYEPTLKLFPKLPTIERLKTQPLSAINFAWENASLQKPGYGYLIPRLENEKILGCVFDSYIFPQQNKTENELRLTVMMREPDTQVALAALARHLNLTQMPDEVHINAYPQAIANYPVGHPEKIQAWLERAKELYPNVHFLGGFTSKPSVNDRILLF